MWVASEVGLARLPREKVLQVGLARLPREKVLQVGLARLPREKVLQVGLARLPREKVLQVGYTRLAVTSTAMTAKIPSLHHFFWRPRAPQVRGRRIFRPHLRPLRVVAMPGARFEIAELLVLYQIELAEQFGDQSIRAAVIGE